MSAPRLSQLFRYPEISNFHYWLQDITICIFTMAISRHLRRNKTKRDDLASVRVKSGPVSYRGGMRHFISRGSLSSIGNQPDRTSESVFAGAGPDLSLQGRWKPGLLICLALISIFQAGSAVPETHTMGPYQISFDLNTSARYSVVIEKPVKSLLSESRSYTTYGLGVIGESGNIYVFVTGYDKVLRLDQSDSKMVEDYLLEMECQNIKITEESYQGRPGALGAGTLPSEQVVFAGSYSPDGLTVGEDYVGMTNCRWVSTFPAQETVNLISTLEVIRINETEQKPSSSPEQTPSEESSEQTKKYVQLGRVPYS
ncbi:MAG: hypothetical protein A4E45_02029 [Methanosaeta sp. PtaB.Bin039]|nr:MAG: hypothetical protein A4E45_02029 [Methanosaeta sp. PtaB.Bin039]